MMIQRLVAVADAALAASIVPIAVSEIGKKYKNFTLFRGFKVSTAQVGGVAAFALVLGLWFTPLAPIKVGVPAAEDLVNWLSNEVMVVTLALPDPLLATIELPAAPRQAITAAAQIPVDDRPFAQAMKAIAEARYADARKYLDQVEKSGDVEPTKWHLARGQLELFGGRPWNAPQWFDKAVADAPTDLEILCQSASAWALAGNYAKAAEIGQTLLERAESNGAAAANMVPVAYNLLAAVKICQGHLQDAEAFSQKSQAIVEKAGAADAWPQAATHLAASRNNLAVMYAMYPSKYAGAESQFRAADDAWRMAYEREENSRQATGQANLAMLYLVEAKYALADHTFKEALRQQRRVLPPKHPNLAMTIIGQGMLEYTLGRYAEAQRLAAEADECLDQHLRLRTAVALRLRGQLDLAEGHYTWGNGDIGTAAKFAHELLPANHPFFAELLSDGARLDVARGDFAQADLTCKQAVDLLTTRLGKQHPLLACIYNTWGQACLLQSRRADAQKYFQQSRAVLDTMEKDTKTKSIEAARTMAGLASLARKSGWRDASTELRKAIAMDNELLIPLAPPPTPEAPGPPLPHPDVAGYNQALGNLFANFGSTPADWEQAASYYQQALTQREAQLQPDHPEIAAVLEEYAALQHKRGEDGQAATMEKRAKQIRAKIKSEGDIQPDRPTSPKEPAAQTEK
jgi:hypothetical protein